MTRFLTIVACILGLIVSGCIMPKDFEAKLDVQKDGGYTFVYDGSIVVLTMLADLEKGVMDDAAEKKAAEDVVAELEKDEHISNVSYLGDAVFKMSYKASGQVDGDTLVVGMREMPICRLEKDDDADTVVFQFLPGIGDMGLEDEFPESAISPKGTVVVTTELEVESTAGNPAATAGAYTWTVDGIEGEMPAVTMRLPQ